MPTETMSHDPRTPLQRYQDDLERPDFERDAAQQIAIEHIQGLYAALTQDPPPSSSWWQRVLGSTPASTRGLYLWGGVGRGKTYLMDCFYECLPLTAKRRVHFHRFMEDVHRGLKRYSDQRDPLVHVGQTLAEQAQVLCFDEFFVSDIADAMILAGLLSTMFDHGVTLIATSNVEPKNLYRDGLQRAKFLPAIDLLEQHARVLNVDGGTDYRLRILERAEIYHFPLDEAAWTSLEQSFRQLAPGDCQHSVVIHINGRPVEAIGVSEGVAWFQFDELCQKARGVSDYIELARRFNTVLLSNVPKMADGMNDPARRFIHLVDELYDRHVNLILSAECDVDQIYTGERLEFEFRRTASRLMEMQTHDYLATEHRP
jgi:cell division protein ZapE